MWRNEKAGASRREAPAGSEPRLHREMFFEMGLGPVRSDQIEPGFVDKLTKSCRAGMAILGVWIAVQFNLDDPFDHRIDGYRPG